MSDTPEGFVPNPLFMTGRIDTSAGESGESLHKLNSNVFGVTADGVLAADESQPGVTIGDPEAIVLQSSPLGTNGALTDDDKREEGTPTQATFNPAAGTVDTSGPEGIHHEDFDPDAQPKNEEGEPGDAAVDPDGPPAEGADTTSGSPAAEMRAKGEGMADPLVVDGTKDKDEDGEGVDNTDGDNTNPEPTDWGGHTVAELKAEIESRNKGREESLSMTGNKADLVAVLTDDDKAALAGDTVDTTGDLPTVSKR